MHYTINKRNVIIAAIKSRLKVANHNYGVDIPSYIEHAISLDAINGNLLWQESLYKEMHNVSFAFEILPTGAHMPVGWKNSYGHLIWDLNMYFKPKARWVEDGHHMPDPK